jgi:hypothetical protein
VQRREVGSKNENKKRQLKIKILLFTKLNRYWRVSLRHTLREGNACIDFLARHGANNNEVYSSIANPPFSCWQTRMRLGSLDSLFSFLLFIFPSRKKKKRRKE